ncbi:Xylulose kinase [bioreactor metagenome]|uniref:Xylulose kinase n=1 Tax=bioreactor metagenome TaxID=1076179 RepID=A0A644Z8A9_9ZZZZ|nr:FGGY family carbohydrate kinase [Christensenella sp.]
MDYFLTFDIGTTSVKTCVFDQQLRMLGHANGEYLLLADRPGYVELDAETYVQAVLQGAKEAIARAGINPRHIVSLSCTTQGETLIPIAQDGAPLARAIVWLDERASEEADLLSKQFPAERFYRETGLPELNGYTPIAKLLWIKNHRPELYASTRKFLLLEDYIIFRLTGACITEKALATSTGWFQLASDGYWDEMLQAAGIDREKLPELLECGTVVPAAVLPEIRAALGFSDSVQIVTGAMDQTAGAVGAGNLSPGILTETTGTALCLVATLDTPDLGHPSRVTVYRHIAAERYLMITISMTAGMFLKWFKDVFCEPEARKAEREHRSVYALFDEIVSTTEPGANGLIAYPYLNGSLQPHQDASVRGIFFGMGLDSKKEHFLRAIFEGIACLLRENLELIEAVNHLRVGEIRSLGGGAKSDVWRQIKADVTQRPIALLAQSECASLGAAILAAVALGYYPDAASAAAKANAVADYKQPDLTLAPLYDKLYESYSALYPRLQPLFDATGRYK